MSLQDVRAEVLSYINTQIAKIDTKMAELTEDKNAAISKQSEVDADMVVLQSDRADYIAAKAKIEA